MSPAYEGASPQSDAGGPETAIGEADSRRRGCGPGCREESLKQMV